MNKASHLLYGLPIAALLLSCSAPAESEDAIPKAKTQTEQQAVVSENPSEWISADDIRSIIGVGSSFEIDEEFKDYTFPACSYEWDDKKVTKTMQVGGSPMEIAMPSEVMIVLAQNIDAKKFERSTAVYKDGISVEGFGDEAVWGEEMSQLSFRQGSLMWHIHVKVDNDSAVNKKHAQAIASFLIKKM